MVISSNQLSINIRKRGSWGTNRHRLGIVCYIEGASSYKKCSGALNLLILQELRCLQDHLDDLGQKCRQAVGNFTVEEAEDVQMNRKLIAACAPMLRKFCQVRKEVGVGKDAVYTRPAWGVQVNHYTGFPPILIRIVQWVLNVQGW